MEVIKPLRMETTGPRPLSSDEVEDLQGMFHWPWLKKIALDHRVAQDAVNLEQWERSAALEKVNRLVAVEAPRMLTYGVTHRAAPKGNFFENLHRARAASAR